VDYQLYNNIIIIIIIVTSLTLLPYPDSYSGHKEYFYLYLVGQSFMDFPQFDSVAFFKWKRLANNNNNKNYSLWLESSNLGDLLRLWVRPDLRIILSPGFSRGDHCAPDTSESEVLCRLFSPISAWRDSRAVNHL